MSIRVRIEHGQGAGTTFRLAKPGVYLIGRVPDSSIQVLDMRVSKAHCEIHLGDDGRTAVLRDLGSTHGCQLNAQPVKGQAALKAGDELRMGMSILRILSDGDADKEIAPKGGQADTSGTHKAAEDTHRTLPADGLVGKDLGGYLIEKKIGAGGMGGVYLAEQLSLHRKVALKVLNEKFTQDSAFIDQFVNEARAAGALNHPNVVQVYDVGSAQGHHFFSMEVMPGGSIEDKLKGGGASWEDALNWFIDASNALIFAKRKNILHRDVKPDNLMLAEDGSAKLCDLGLAKKSEVSDLMDQGIIGTPHFISPEAIRRRPNIDHRTDLYSLGCTFYRVLTGTNPYPGKTVKEILLGHLNKPAPRVSALNSDVPRDLDDVIQKLMAKDPEDRFQTPTELLASLDKVRLRHGLEAHGLQRSRKPAIIAGVIAAIAIGVGIFFAMKPDTVVVQKKTVQQLEAERQQAIGAARVDVAGVLASATTTMATLAQSEVAQPFDKTWNQPLWNDIVTDYRKAAKGWEGTKSKWQTSYDEAKDPDIGAQYRRGMGELTTKVESANGKATALETKLRNRSARAADIDAAQAEARTELAETLDERKKKVSAANEAKDYLTMIELLMASDIDAIATDFTGRKLDEFELLDPKEEIWPEITKRFGTKPEDGLFYGTDLIAAALKAMESADKAAYKGIDEAAGDAPTPDSLGNAVEAASEYVRALPTVTDSQLENLGEVSKLLRRYRTEAERRKEALTEKRAKLIASRFGSDNAAYQKLLRRLFAPRSGGGLLQSFDTASAAVETKAFLGKVKTDEYRAFGEHWARANVAVRALIDRTVKAYPDGWTSDKRTYVDSKGKTQTDRYKDVSPTSFKLDRDSYTLIEQGPAWLLEYLFFDGDTPRVEYEGSDHLGLATLAELAGDYDLAEQQYMSYISAIEATDRGASTGARARIEASTNERKAASRWREAVRRTEEIKAVLDAHDPAIIGQEEFDEEKRAAINAAQSSLAKKLQESMSLRQALANDAALATTIWRAATHDGTEPLRAAYAGEELPPAPPAKPPAKAPAKPPGK